jgi:hypothetical protein
LGIYITTPAATYTCTQAGGEGTCFASAGGIGGNPFAGLIASFASYEAISGYLGAFGDTDVETSTENIAGTDASCFEASGDFVDDEGTIKWCFAESGLLLLSSYDLADSPFEMRATDFSDDVPDDAFAPPYEVTELGG